AIFVRGGFVGRGGDLGEAAGESLGVLDEEVGQRRVQRGYSAARAAAAKTFDELMLKAVKRLARFERDVTVVAAESVLGPVLVGLLIENAEGFAGRFAEVVFATDEVIAHEGR